jgi:hypothetical protein
VFIEYPKSEKNIGAIEHNDKKDKQFFNPIGFVRIDIKKRYK